LEEHPLKAIRRELSKRGIRHSVEEGGALIRIPLEGINKENILGGAEPDAKVTNGRWTYPSHVKSIQKIIPERTDYLFHVTEADYVHDAPTIEEAAAEAVRMKNAASRYPGAQANTKIMKMPVEQLVRNVMERSEKTRLFRPTSLLIRIASWQKLAEKLTHR